MTSPNQHAPDGAYVIDGNGGETNFGQGMTESGAASLMTGGFTSINLGDPLGAIESVASLFIKTLSQIPLEVLQLFEGLIPDALEGAFSTVAGAIDAIFNHIQSLGPLLASAFNGFLEASYNVLQSAFGQIMDIVQGLIVTPINGAVAGFKDWFVGLMGGTIPDLGAAVNGAVDDLSDLIHNLLTTPASVLGSLPQTLVSGLDGVVDGLNDGINDAVGFIRDIIDAIVRGIRGIPFVGGSIAAAITNLTGAVSDNQANQQNAVITLSASGSRNPGWVARYPISDVSYPEAFNSASFVFGATGPQSTGTAHTHSFDGTQANTQNGTVYALNGEARASLITVSNSTVFDTVGMILQKNPGGAPTPVTIEVYRLDSAGNASRLFASSDVSSMFATGGTYVELSLPAPIIAQSGEKYMVKVLNSSASAQQVAMPALVPFLSAATAGMLFTGSLATQTSYTASDISFGHSANARIPWAILATTNGVPNDQSYSDDFNRVTLGSLWLPMSDTGTDQLLISSFTSTKGRVYFSGSTTGNQVALYTKPVAGDQMLVEANLYDRIGTIRLGVMSCCNRDLTKGVYLGVNNSTANIYTGAWNSLTQQKSVSVSSTDAKFGLYRDPSASKFTILKDGADIGSWVDTGGVVATGEDYRYGGIRISRNAVVGGMLDNWTMRDAVL